MPIDLAEEVVQKTNDGRLMADLSRKPKKLATDSIRPIADVQGEKNHSEEWQSDSAI